MPLGSWPPASVVSVSPAVSLSLGHPHDFIDLISEAQLSTWWWESFISSWGALFSPGDASFLGKAGNHSFSNSLRGPKPHRIFTSCWSLWPGLSPTSRFSAPQIGWFHWLGGQEHSAPQKNCSPCMAVLVQVFLAFPLGWLASVQSQGHCQHVSAVFSSSPNTVAGLCPAWTLQLPPLSCALISREKFPL